MADWRLYKSEIIILVILLIYMLFTLTNVNQSLGNAYLWFLTISLILLFVNIFIFDKQIRVTFQKEKGKWVEAIFAGIVGWALILAVSYFVFKIADPTKANIASIIKSFAAANPAFAGSKILNFITVGVAIGFSETNFFGRILEFVCDLLHIPIKRETISNFRFVILAIFLGIVFAIFHATAKGISATNSLIVVAIMMIISIGMIAYFNGETRQAILMHVTSNSVAAAMVLMAGGNLFN
jgi:hypothetical protein